VDFSTVSTVGLESSPVAAALASLGVIEPLFLLTVRDRLWTRVERAIPPICPVTDDVVLEAIAAPIRPICAGTQPAEIDYFVSACRESRVP
jgi:hypothetical protein